MTLHLIKLAARATGVDDLINWQTYVRETHGELFHTTRMMPKRVNELLDDGSIYWVINPSLMKQVLKGVIFFLIRNSLQPASNRGDLFRAGDICQRVMRLRICQWWQREMTSFLSISRLNSWL